ncbi:MAG: MinD/ParA family protein [Lachnospiraceae bacterium]|nr:MinD/ParA family protein [Lachnospiraceae bacterium]
MADQAENLRNLVKMGSPDVQKSARPAARVITVTSGKGGVGKSNTAINLAIQMKKMGKRVIILDADFGLANIEIMFGTVPKYNFADLIYQGKNIRDIITWGPDEVGFISGGSGIAGMSGLDRGHLTTIIRNLADLDALTDIIIIDTAAGISDMVLEFLVASGEIILVTTPEPTSITDSYSLLKAVSRHPRFYEEETIIRVLSNRVESVEEGKSLFTKLNAVVNRYLSLSIGYLGSIPQDKAISDAVMQQMPVSLHNPKAKSARAYEKIVNFLLTGQEEAEIKKRGMAAFFYHLVGTKNLADKMKQG